MRTACGRRCARCRWRWAAAPDSEYLRPSARPVPRTVRSHALILRGRGQVRRSRGGLRSIGPLQSWPSWSRHDDARASRPGTSIACGAVPRYASIVVRPRSNKATAPRRLPRATWVTPTASCANPCHNARSGSAADLHAASSTSWAWNGHPLSSKSCRGAQRLESCSKATFRARPSIVCLALARPRAGRGGVELDDVQPGSPRGIVRVEAIRGFRYDLVQTPVVVRGRQ